MKLRTILLLLALCFPVYAQTYQQTVTVSGTSHTFTNAQSGRQYIFTSGSSVAVSLPQAGASSLFRAGWYVEVKVTGAGTVTITPTTSTIGGAASLALTTGQSVKVSSNGTNYLVARLDITDAQRTKLASNTQTGQTIDGDDNTVQDLPANTVFKSGTVIPAANITVSVVDGSANYCADAGSNDTYACTLSPAPASYVTGSRYRFKANTANTGATTINFNALGAKTIKKVAGGVTTDLADNDIRVGQVVEVAYDGTNMQMQSTLGNAASGSGDMVLADAQTVGGAKTFDPAKLIVGGVGTLPTVVPQAFAVDSDDGKLYFGVDDTADYWGEVFVNGKSGPVGVTQGGTGLAVGTSGGIPYFNTTTSMASSGALTVSLPVFGGGAGAAPVSGTRTGNTTQVATSTGTQTGGDLVSIDSNGNHIASGFQIGQSPINSQSTAYTLVIGDAGKSILHPTADNNARTFTIPANGSVAYPIGTTITIVNQINTVTISITTDTLVLAGAGTTGSRTLAANGMCTIIKVSATVWYISGVGLT